MWCERPDGVRHGPARWCEGTPEGSGLPNPPGDCLEGFFVDGRRRGLWSGYRGDLLLSETEYRNGVPEGRQTLWDEASAQESAQGSLQRGKRTGEWRLFDASGLLAETVTYRRGMRHGPWSRWQGEGRKVMEGAYRKGERHGAFRQLAADGRLLGEFQMTGDSGTWREWHENGKPRLSEPLRGGKVHGLREEWDDQGRRMRAEEYIGGLREGQLLEFFPDGRKHIEATYRAGKRQGPWRSWHPNGQPAEEGQYADDWMIGHWRRFKDSGEVFEERDYLGEGR
jgi:antitoxin component YwqK of YwqJK toxin-antitoxin module